MLDKLHLVVGDITDAPRMLDLVEELRPDYIYHFAAQAINGISYSVPEMTLDTNVVGTLNLLEAVRRHGLKTRVLLAGSSTEYGRTADVWKGAIPETAPLEPVSPYGVSKVRSLHVVKQAGGTFPEDISVRPYAADRQFLLTTFVPMARYKGSNFLKPAHPVSLYPGWVCSPWGSLV